MLVVPHIQVSIAQSRTAPLQLYHRITRGYMFALFQSLNREQPLCNLETEEVTILDTEAVSIAQSRTAPLQPGELALCHRQQQSFNRSIANSPSATERA